MEHETPQFPDTRAYANASIRFEEETWRNRRIDESLLLIKPIGPKASALKNSRIGAEIQGLLLGASIIDEPRQYLTRSNSAGNFHRDPRSDL